jgi:hypothetical protein
MGIDELSKSQMATYLYVRDIIKSEAEINNYMNVNDMMLYLMPIILIIIFILIGILFYKNNETEKIIYDKDRIE